jgi:ankyrin repeat protein
MRYTVLLMSLFLICMPYQTKGMMAMAVTGVLCVAELAIFSHYNNAEIGAKLIEKAQSADLNGLKKLLGNAYLTSADARNNNDETALMYAATPEIAHYLIDMKANIYASSPETSKTPLLGALNNAAVMRSFFTHAASKDRPMLLSHGRDALMKAAEVDDVEVVKLLLEYKADPTFQNNKGQNALIYAKEHSASKALIQKAMIQQQREEAASDPDKKEKVKNE